MTNVRAGAAPAEHRCDVLVLGGGPAGLATAIELRQASDLSVIVAEARDQSSERHGESLPPDIVLALERLGVRGAFLADGHLPCPGSVSLWGDDRLGYNDFILNPLGPGWHISRARFEVMLRARSIECGAAVRPRSRAVDAVSCGDGFAVTLRTEAGRQSVVHTSWVVDATGWQAWFARRQGAARRSVERLVAIVRFATVRDGPFTAQTLVEAAPDGWWYGARLPDDRIVTALLTAPRNASAVVRDDHTGWRERLADTQLLGGRLADCTLVDERFGTCPAPSGILDRTRGERWVAVGDAASAYDPIAARGIHTALSDARDAAATILAEAFDVGPPASDYDQQVNARFKDYLADRAQLYAQHRRWVDRSDSSEASGLVRR